MKPLRPRMWATCAGTAADRGRGPAGFNKGELGQRAEADPSCGVAPRSRNISRDVENTPSLARSAEAL